MTLPSPSLTVACVLSALFSLLPLPQVNAAEEDAVAEDAAGTNESRHMDSLDDRKILSVGDRLTYQVIEERETPIIVFVNANGEVDIPLIGPVAAEGETARSLAHEIKSLLEVDYFHRATVMLQSPQVAVSRGSVDIAGAVRTPRTYALPADQILTVSSAIAMAGGMTADSDGSEVTLVRQNQDGNDSAGESREVIDVSSILDSGNFDQDLPIQDGDLIIVPRRTEAGGGTIYVVGAVNAPGILQVPPGDTLTVSKAILQSGGFSRFARKKQVKLISGDSSLPEDERTEIVNVEEILQRGLREKDPVVEPNDIIRVEERIIAF
ncbi:MAG: SLBB domain-containing protein [Opitutales bacterium]